MLPHPPVDILSSSSFTISGVRKSHYVCYINITISSCRQLKSFNNVYVTCKSWIILCQLHNYLLLEAMPYCLIQRCFFSGKHHSLWVTSSLYRYKFSNLCFYHDTLISPMILVFTNDTKTYIKFMECIRFSVLM